MVGNSESELEISFYRKNIKDNFVFFDVGARDSNIPDINDNVKYYLFEPIKFNYKNLVDRFGSKNNVIIENLCLSNKKETTNIYVESESIHKRMNFNYIWSSVNQSRVINGETEEINCITLKDYIENNGIKKIDIMKIDVEGYEFNVIQGLFEHLSIVDMIVFEYSIGTYSSSGSNLLQVLNLLNGFNFYIIDNASNNVNLLEGSVNEIYDRLKNINNCNIVAKRNG